MKRLDIASFLKTDSISRLGEQQSRATAEHIIALILDRLLVRTHERSPQAWKKSCAKIKIRTRRKKKKKKHTLF
jgi:hypothetical protein